MSRTVKLLVALVAIALLWKVVSGGTSEVEVDYEPEETIE